MTLAVLEPTLRLFFKSKTLLTQHFVLRMMTESEEDVNKRAKKLLNQISNSLQGVVELTIEKTNSQAGSGALPLEKIPSRSVVLRPLKENASKIAAQLRQIPTPVIGYIQDDKVYLDMRTVREDEISIIKKALLTLK